MVTITPDIKFYDTSALLAISDDKLFDEKPFLISSITLQELEHIKNSSHKDEDIKYRARNVLRLLDSHFSKYTVIIHELKNETLIKSKHDLEINNDMRILSDAIAANNDDRFMDRVIFITNDLMLEVIANLFFGDGQISSVHNSNDSYTGYKELVISDEQLAVLYENISENHFDLLPGQYIILKNSNNEIIDIKVWDGTTHRNLTHPELNSKHFGKMKPYDIYQKMACDSFNNNTITMLKGPAGSGKSILSLAYLISQLEKGKIDKIIVFCNPVATVNSARLGFYPGDKNTKLLDSQIGNMLASKFGSSLEVENLIATNKLILLPLCDIRGYDTSGMAAGIYITEAQNLDRTLMKLALSRIGEDCICIIDGDPQSQTDLEIYKQKNGMDAVSKAFRGEKIYGEVTLQKIHRSAIAEIANRIPD